MCRFYFRLRTVQITHRKGVHQEFTLGSFVAVYTISGNTRKTEEKKREREREVKRATYAIQADHRIARVHFVIDNVRSARSRDIGRSSGRRRDKSVSTRRRSSKFHERKGAREENTQESTRREGGREGKEDENRKRSSERGIESRLGDREGQGD